MACFVPQLMRLSDAHSVHLRTHRHSHQHHQHHQHHHSYLKTREAVCFRGQCMSSSTAAVIDVQKLQIPTLDPHATSLQTIGSLPYIGAVGPPGKIGFKEDLTVETLLRSDEAAIEAAAAEAIALAKAALDVAKDAASMAGDFQSTKSTKPGKGILEAELLRMEMDRLTELEEVDSADIPATYEKTRSAKQNLLLDHSDDLDNSDFDEEFYSSQTHLKSIAVRSGRQTERRARRAKAAEKTAANPSLFKSGSMGKKRHAALQDIDYSDPLRYLRATTNSAKLLTVTEEQELSEAIQDLLKLERLKEELADQYGQEPTFAQWAAAAGLNQKTLRHRLNYGTLCKDKMIKSNIRLVISIAKNYQGAGMNLQDLVQEGCRGLVRGAEKFDASKGFKFSTYAHWWIKQAVRKSLSDQSRTIRLPFHMVEATYRVREAKKQLYNENGRHPDNEEVAEAAGLSMKRLTAVMLTPKAPRSLDQKIGINQNLKPSDVISDPDAETSEEVLIKQFMKQDLEKVLDSLTPREKKVIRWRFGLEDGRMKTLQEIGELMGVSRERIRQIESCAFRKLKNKRRTKHLKQYVMS
ncbi:RNA polymerase sigma factor [Nymphaea thermarum]|nr:RNA polymerase sigma factor [Nymphaea thermarum]